MKKKASRLAVIKQIISDREISSQEELLQELIQEGFELTQATLSRDLKQLKVAKAALAGDKYIYVLPSDMMYQRDTPHHLDKGRGGSGFKSIHFSGNIAVIKTRPGHASSIAYDIDSREPKDIIGTIAGDDTIMLVLREGADRETVRNFLSFTMPH